MNSQYISLEEKRLILKSVMEAEKQTSVEFQVHIDKSCKGDVIEKASAVFNFIHLNKTKTKKWLLFYLSLEDQKYAIIGDKEMNEMIPENFWDLVENHMQNKINEGNLTACLSEGIKMAGDQIRNFIPKQINDINELPDEISLGKEFMEVYSER